MSGQGARGHTFLLFDTPWPTPGSGQGRPGGAQKLPRGPKRTQRGPRAQERPKNIQEGPQSASRAPIDASKSVQEPPKSGQGCPRSGQEEHKSVFFHVFLFRFVPTLLSFVAPCVHALLCALLCFHLISFVLSHLKRSIDDKHKLECDVDSGSGGKVALGRAGVRSGVGTEPHGRPDRRVEH